MPASRPTELPGEAAEVDGFSLAGDCAVKPEVDRSGLRLQQSVSIPLATITIQLPTIEKYPLFAGETHTATLGTFQSQVGVVFVSS